MEQNFEKTNTVLDANLRPTRDEGSAEHHLVATVRSKTAKLWAAFALLLMALMAVAGYGYRRLKWEGFELSQVPELVKSVTELRARLNGAEGQLRSWAEDWRSTVERVGKLERRSNRNLQLARQYAEDLTAGLEARVVDQMDERDSVIDGRLNRVEFNQEQERTHLAKLQAEVASLRGEVVAVRQELTGNFSSLHQQLAGNDRQADALANRLEFQRLDFEISKGRSQELVPGISLRLKGTNTRFQRVNGWLWVLPDRRTLWLRNRGVEEPLVFYRKQGAERCELVISRVSRNSAVGYLLQPASEDSSAGGPIVSEAGAIASAASGR